MVDGYLAHLGREGKSEGTIFSYRMDLAAALEHFGADTAVASLTPAKVAAFYASDGVTKKRNGKKKSEITVMKCRRVFRLALVWAAERGLIEKAPIPAEELEHARGAARKDATAVKAVKKPRKAAKADPEPVAPPTPEPATQPVTE
jgi:site-specific recombinase XerC